MPLKKNSSQILEIRLKEEHGIRELLVTEFNDIYLYWKIHFLWNKIKTYASDPQKIKWKFESFIRRIIGNETGIITPYPDTYTNAYKNKLLKYIFLLYKKHNKIADLNKIQKILDANPDKPIIVYPQTIHWEPLQRPQQLLREFGKQGYLCFFCEPEEPVLKINHVSENVYTVSGERYLIYPLKKRKVIVLCTWMLNLPFINLLEDKIIWYDLIDRLELFSLYDENMLECHNQLVLGADIVTYSASELQKLVISRHDAEYLPNGVFCDDFEIPSTVDTNRIEAVNSRFIDIKKPIIGFYGSIAEWLNYSLIKGLAELRQDWNFVFIGKIWTNIDSIKTIPNIHMIDEVPYHDLPLYAKQFDVAIIPFLINEITNSVSPIKFFEYAALGKPVVATPFNEIAQYKDQSFLQLADSAEEFSEKIDKFLNIDTCNIEDQAKLFAHKNQWKERVNLVERKLNEREVFERQFLSGNN